jgi:hypothetical protein
VEKELVDLEHLELHRVGADARSGIDELETTLEIAVVIAGDFRDEFVAYTFAA